MEKTEKAKITKEEKAQKRSANVECEDRCPYHGTLSIRGRRFDGTVTKIVGRRLLIEWERIIYHPKFERFSRLKSKLHAHIPKCMMNDIKVGDYVEIGECRPLSKIIHFAVVKKLKSKEEKK
jgi:ribosomal protein uS17